jgi:hypothetical protein
LKNSRINNNLKQVGRFFDENINDEKGACGPIGAGLKKGL